MAVKMIRFIIHLSISEVYDNCPDESSVESVVKVAGLCV